MNRIVTQFAQMEESGEESQGKTLNISNAAFAEFFNELNELEIQYLAVGHLAGAYHGCPRACGSIELWLASEDKNIKKLQHLLHIGPDLNTNVGGQSVTFRGESFHLTTYLQLLHYSSKAFYKCYAESESAIVLNAKIPVLSMKDLIHEKMASRKPEDRSLVEALESPW